VAPADRINIVVAGQDVPFGMTPQGWTSAEMGSYFSKILLEEILGYNSIFTETSGATLIGMMRVAGCLNAEKEYDAICGDPFSTTHLLWERWVLTNSYDPVKDALEGIMPIDLGSTGYDGIETAYVMQGPLDAAYAEKGLSLEWHMNWNVSWHDSKPYFASIFDYPDEQLREAKDTRFANEPMMLKFAEVTGDVDGVELVEVDGVQRTWAKTTWGGQQTKWWLAPACRHAPETCVPVIFGGTGWSMDSFIQKSVAINAPWALAVALDWSHYTKIPKEHSGVIQWFEPDGSFLQQAPRRVFFAARDETAWEEGDVRTDVGSTLLLKLVHWSIPAAAPLIPLLLQNIKINMGLMRQLLLEVEEGSSTFDVACNYLKQHPDVWEPWIPLATACISGMGMINQNGEFQDERASASSCDWCSVGRFSEPFTDEDGLSHRCVACMPGTNQPMPGQLECTNCEPGRFQDVAGKSFCADCAAGSYQEGGITPTSCTSCSPGSYSAEMGKSECLSCPGGWFAPAQGQVECSMCLRGSFANGAGNSACTSCAVAGPLESTTENIASSDVSACQCPEGLYLPIAGKACQPCPEGMSCAFGADEQNVGKADAVWPVALEGFMTRESAPLLVYKCLLPEHCPGGACADGACFLQACAPHRDRDSVACGRCEEGAYQSGEDCQPCVDGVSALPMVVFLLVAFCAIAVHTVSVNRDKNKTAWDIGALVSFTCLLTAVQTTSVYLSMDITWGEPLGPMMKAVSIGAFDLSVLSPSCVMGVDPAPLAFFRQFLVPALLGAIAIAVVVKQRFMPGGKFVPQFANAAGAIMMMFFVSVCISAFNPLVCYSHPGHDGMSMRTDSSVLCFDSDEHSAMLGASALGFAINLVPFLSATIFAVRRYPRAIAERDMDFMQGFRFLFYRFKPHAYFFGMAFLLRNLLVCLVPAVIRDNAAAQIVMMSMVFLFSTIGQTLLQPWRSSSANVLDGCMTGCIILILLCGAVSGGYETSDATTQGISIFIVVGFLLMWAGLFGGNVYRQYNNLDKYDMFICHHKVGAAAQVRLVRTMLAEKGAKVFVDSDDIEQMDFVFDIISAKVRALVVYLTRDTLTRPTCVGEIVTAFKTNTDVTAIMTPSFVAPTEQQLGEIHVYLGGGGTDALIQYGIAMADVQKYFLRLMAGQGCDASIMHIISKGGQNLEAKSCTHVQVETAPSCTKDFQSIVDQLIPTSGLPQASSSPTTQDAPTRGCVFVCADPSDPEATAAGCILISMAKAVLVSVKEGICLLSDHMPRDKQGVSIQSSSHIVEGARALAVVLSQKTIYSCHQLEIMVHVAEQQELVPGSSPATIPVRIEGFSFPDLDYYDHVLPKIWPEVSNDRIGHIKSFFRTMSNPLSIHASDMVLQAQTKSIFSSIPNTQTESVVHVC
jgi:hypothetical protein